MGLEGVFYKGTYKDCGYETSGFTLETGEFSFKAPLALNYGSYAIDFVFEKAEYKETEA